MRVQCDFLNMNAIKKFHFPSGFSNTAPINNIYQIVFTAKIEKDLTRSNGANGARKRQ